mmetsp:Transcript_40291/g.61486  ORF Transcript_40291/g.61486 Transcript_40291/m.61486 type:complete len:85 (-) Transcript_40291:1487-1741(-)
MAAIYCRWSNTPYESQAHLANFKRVAYVSAYWTFAFMAKLGANMIPSIDILDPAEQSATLLVVIIYFGISIVCDIVPFFLVIDS